MSKILVKMTESRSTVADRLVGLLLHRHFVLGCLALNILLRVGLVLLVPVTMASDAAWYLNRATGIAAGSGYSEGGLPTAYWPVGYPAFLGLVFWLFGSHVIAAQVVNVLLSAGSALLTLALARVMLRDEAPARLAMLLLTVYPNNIAYASLTLSETFFTAVLMSATYVYIRYPTWLGAIFSGTIFGVAALVKPQVLFFPLMLVGVRCALEPRGPRLRVAVLGIALYASMAAILAPWAVRNFLVFHEVVLISTNGGPTLLTGNTGNKLSAQGKYSSDDPLVIQMRFSVADQVAANKRATRLAMQWIWQNPGRFVAMMPLKIWWLWAPDGEAEWAYQAGFARYDEHAMVFRLVRLLNQAFYVAILIAFAISAPMAGRRGVPSSWLFLSYGFAVYVTIIAIVFSGQSRYHFPVMPWVMIGAAWSAMELLRRWSSSTAR
jgi:hypothetical protein